MALALVLCSCDGESDSGGASDGDAPGGSTAKLSAEEKQAQDAVLAEIQKRWVRSADGWITALDSGNNYTPIPYLRQAREINVSGVEAWDLSEADKANGFEWTGEVSLKPSVFREVGEIGFVLDGMAQPIVDRHKGQWSQWIDYAPEAVQVQKRAEKWQVDTDTFMMRGTIPTDENFATAGVSR
jgi:hypothetical protein